MQNPLNPADGFSARPHILDWAVCGIKRDLKQNYLRNVCGEHSLNILISFFTEVAFIEGVLNLFDAKAPRCIQ